jgi:hypothetical protein
VSLFLLRRCSKCYCINLKLYPLLSSLFSFLIRVFKIWFQSVYMYKRFDKNAIDEVLRLGIVAQLPKLKLTQIEFTAPKMFEYFNVDRMKLFDEQRTSGNVMFQVQAGLLFIDAGNATMKETFFKRWAACANNDDCLIPDDIFIKKTSLHLMKNYSIKGHRVFRLVCLVL